MRPLTKSISVVVRTLREIRRALTDQTEHLRDDLSWRTPDRDRELPVKTTHVVNYLLCWYLTRPEAERDRIAAEGREIFDRHRGLEGPQPLTAGPSLASSTSNVRHPRPLGNSGARIKHPAGKRQANSHDVSAELPD